MRRELGGSMNLKLKEWIAKVTSFINSFHNGSTTGNVELNCYRKGHIVSLQSFTNFPAASDGATIATIPARFRPQADADFVVFNTSGTRLGTIRISTNGTIKPVFGALTAGTVRDTFTYIGGVLYSSILKAFRSHQLNSEGVAV